MRCSGCNSTVVWDFSKRSYQCEYCGNVYSALDYYSLMFKEYGGWGPFASEYVSDLSYAEDNLNHGNFSRAITYYESAANRYPTFFVSWVGIVQCKSRFFSLIPDFKIVREKVKPNLIGVDTVCTVTPTPDVFFSEFEPYIAKIDQTIRQSPESKKSFYSSWNSYKERVVSAYNKKVAEARGIQSEYEGMLRRRFIVRCSVSAAVIVASIVFETVFIRNYSANYRRMIDENIGQFFLANVLLLLNTAAFMLLAFIGSRFGQFRQIKWICSFPAIVNSVFSFMIFKFEYIDGVLKANADFFTKALTVVLGLVFFGGVGLGVIWLSWNSMSLFKDKNESGGPGEQYLY